MCPPSTFVILRLCFVVFGFTGMTVLIFRSLRREEKETEGLRTLVLKVFTNWFELSAQALVMAMQAATIKEGLELSNLLQTIYEFIQALDDPFFLFLPLDCFTFVLSPVHAGLIVGLVAPIILFLSIFVYQICFHLHVAVQKSRSESLKGVSKSCSSVLTNSHQINEEATESATMRKPPELSFLAAQKVSNVDAQRGAPSRSSSFRVCISKVAKNIQAFYFQFRLAVKSSLPSTVGVFIPIVFLLHPAITRQFLNNLECNQYDKSRLTRDVGLICTEAPHVRFVYLAWAGLLVWTIGLPVIFAAVMHSHKDELSDSGVLAQWGFLLHGYEVHKNRIYSV